jgi:putative hydrolase of the HAD superfamily
MMHGVECTPDAGSPIDAVLLDVGGVLTAPNHALYGPVLRAAGLAPDEATIDRGHYAGIVAMDACGVLAWSNYFEALAVTCGADGQTSVVLAEALSATWDSPRVWSRVLPGAIDGLTRLAATGAALAMVSNSDGNAEESLRLAGVAQVGPGPGVAVAIVVDSHQVGVEKPEPAIFDIALEAVGVSADHAVHVGDTVTFDVRGAQRARVQALHLDPFDLCPDRDDHAHVRSLTEVAQLVERSLTTC